MASPDKGAWQEAVSRCVAVAELLDQRGEAPLSQTMRLGDFEPPKFSAVLQAALSLRRATGDWRRAAYLPRSSSAEPDPERRLGLHGFTVAGRALLAACESFALALTSVRSELSSVLGTDSEAMESGKGLVVWNRLLQDRAKSWIASSASVGYVILSSRPEYKESLARGQQLLKEFPGIWDFIAHVEEQGEGGDPGAAASPA